MSMHNDNGLFITLEGGEGAGKSTQLSRIRDWLEARGHRVITARQPGGTAMSEQIRELLLNNENSNMLAKTELLLMFADRAQFMGECVYPALNAGKTVLCDRFTDSTRAYQGGGRGIDPEQIEQLADLVHGQRQPDLTILLDIPAQQGLDRAASRGAANRLEKEDIRFYERVRACYLQLAANDPARIAVVDARPGPEDVWARIKQVLEARV